MSAVQRVLEANPIYALRVGGALAAPNAAYEVLTALPPNVDTEQKFNIGLWEDEALIAFADAIFGWPASDAAHIGLLMTDGARQGGGVGRRMHDVIIDAVREQPQIKTLRLSIVDTNADLAEPFWKKLGYEPTGEAKPYSSGDVESVARIWSRPVEVGAD
ncbi:MAG: GNAT family N-acetyltransferase [Rhodoglobus sp.]